MSYLEDDANGLIDADYYDLDDEERHGEQTVFTDDVGEEYVINPGGSRVYLNEQGAA